VFSIVFLIFQPKNEALATLISENSIARHFALDNSPTRKGLFLSIQINTIMISNSFYSFPSLFHGYLLGTSEFVDSFLDTGFVLIHYSIRANRSYAPVSR